MLLLNLIACRIPGVHAACQDRKSTRLNSSHSQISYAVFCLKKKKNRESHYSPRSSSVPDSASGGSSTEGSRRSATDTTLTPHWSPTTPDSQRSHAISSGSRC